MFNISAQHQELNLWILCKISQVDLAKEAGVSREIIGTYERNEASPPIEVAKKIADVLKVSLDYLAGGSGKAGFDKQTLKLIDKIEELEPFIKDKLLFLSNAIIRNAKNGEGLFALRTEAFSILNQAPTFF